jgi:Tol biopolymer transport system component
VAVDQTDTDGRNIDVWIYDIQRETSTRLTFDPALDYVPTWSPDGKRILFGSNRTDLLFRLYLKNADGSGPEEEVAGVPFGRMTTPWDWSRDGQYAAIKLDNELWYFSFADPKHALHQLLPSGPTIRNAQFSPDGHWIAYASNESGTMEIYVSPFTSASGKWQVSLAPAERSPDGAEMARNSFTFRRMEK